MDHLVILRRSWRLLPRILAGEKTIESRWYLARRAPWGLVAAGDTLYFKNSGEPVAARARAERVLQFADLNPARVWEILEEYREGLGIGRGELAKYVSRFRDKRYCILIFLADPEAIEPFRVDKTGYGAMAAWIAVADIGLLKETKNRSCSIHAAKPHPGQ